jgi:DNA-binding XRE family transcriptional regulator
LLLIDHINCIDLVLLPFDHMLVRTPEDLARALFRRRAELRLTQQDIANVIGVNRRVIGELEAGKDTVQLKIALAAANAVGLDIELRPRGGSP